MNAITDFFASPEDKDPNFVRLTRNILAVTLTATLISIGIVGITANSRALQITMAVLVIASLLEGIALVQILRGKLTLAKLLIPIMLIVAVTIIALSTNTIHDISVVAYPVIIIISTLLQGRRALVITMPLVIAAITLLGILDLLGLSRSPLSSRTGIDDIVVGVVLILVSAWILDLVIGRLRETLSRAETNERAQLEANRALKELQMNLEQRVDDRTTELKERGLELEMINQQNRRKAAQLEALAQVMEAITSVRDLQQLLPRIASVISEKFGFYHVGVFLLDEAGEYALLSATNSDGGQKMLARNHRLRVGEEGIVGYVTASGEPRIAMDVGSDPVFFDNPELPLTHSEMALPLKIENRIAGALDVQSEETGAFTDGDLQMLELLANQVSLAIENARLFDETRFALAEAEAISRQFIREAWARVPVEHNLLGYRYSVTGAAPLQELVANGPSKQAGSSHIVPILLRGEVIGTLAVQSPSDDPLTQHQIDLIAAVAERVALAAENARLFEETTRRAERERLVSDITGKIRKTHDAHAMVQTAIDELRKALGASRVEVIPQAIQGAES